MNAYELADLMLDVTDCESSEYYQAGMMLRQQADRITELEKDEQKSYEIISDLLERNVALKEQTKPLSDEEIEEVINRTAWVGTEEEIRIKIARAIEAKVRGEK